MAIVVKCLHSGCGRACRVPDNRRGTTVRCPHCQERISVPPDAKSTLGDASAIRATPNPARPSVPRGTPEKIARFEVKGLLGRGAFGVVYRAYDPQADREVALKVPLPGSIDDPQRRQRFLREARAAGQLRHPNIVPLFEAGGQGTDLYIASGLIEGRSLAEAISEGTLTLEQKVQIVRELAEALAYAHSQRIVHRDVKPANVLLDRENHPHLLDFGLAYRRENAKTLTQDGALLGTAAYMAPELLLSSNGNNDPPAKEASDQYALGVLFYELLTGQLPFDGPLEVVLYKAANSDPEPPRKLNPAIPKDVETICLKTFAKNPKDRYANCQDLASDLRRWHDGDPIAARRVGTLERLVRWSRKNPLTAGLLGAVAASLVLGILVVSLLASWALSEAGRAELQATLAKQNEANARRNQDLALSNADRATKSEEKTRKLLEEVKTQKKTADDNYLRAEGKVYASNIALAQAAWQENNVRVAYDYLASCRPEFRGWEHDYVYTLLNSGQRTFRGHTHDVQSVAFSADGKRIVSGSLDKTAKVWDATTGEETLTFKGHTATVTCVSFSADGRRIVSGSYDKTMKMWDATTGREILTFKGHNGPVTSASLSGDGKRIVSGSHDSTVKVWDATTGQETLTIKGHTIGVYSVSFSDDGKRIASNSDENTVKVWDAATGHETLALKGHTGSVSSVSFSPDGKRIVSGSTDKTVKLWNVATGQEILTFKGHTGPVTSASLSGDGKRIVSGSKDNTVKVWDAATGQETLTFKGHTGQVWSVSFSGDGKRIVSGGGDFNKPGELKVWDTATGQEILTLKGQTSQVTSVSFSGDGKRIVSGSYDKTVKLWDAATGQVTLALKGHTAPVMGVSFSGDGKRIVSGSQDNTVKVWDAATSQETLTLKGGHTYGVSCVSFSPDGRRIASGSPDKSLKVWDANLKYR